MNSDSPAGWSSFPVAMVGAAAALTGLLFVAMSINIERVMEEKYSMLPTRAAETLACLVFVTISAALGLVPQNVRLLGLEILVLAVPLLIATLPRQVVDRSGHDSRECS